MFEYREVIVAAAASAPVPGGSWVFEHHEVIMHGFALLGALYLLAFYPLAIFRYRITEGTLEMEWVVLGFIRVSRRRFPLDEIADVSAKSFLRCLWAGRGFHVFGNVFALRGAGIVLKKGVLWTSFGKTIYVTPRDREAFVEQLRTALAGASSGRERKTATSG